MDPHPLTGQSFESPVPPGSGWPEDPADSATTVATAGEAVPELARDSAGLGELAARVSVCRACPRLVEWREQIATTQRRASFAQQPYWGRPVPAFGDRTARFLIVGLAPAAHGANRTGRMFTGDRSGQWLYAALYRAGLATHQASVAAGDRLQLHECRITAPVHCAPPDNKPTAEEKRNCSPWLDRELELSADYLVSVLALGSIGWQAFLAAAVRVGWQVPRPRPKFGHGVTADIGLPSGRTLRLVGCYHVSQQNTFTGRLTESMLDDALRLVTAAG